MADMRRILTRSSGYTSSGPTDCGNCSVLREENYKLKEQLDKSYETVKVCLKSGSKLLASICTSNYSPSG